MEYFCKKRKKVGQFNFFNINLIRFMFLFFIYQTDLLELASTMWETWPCIESATWYILVFDVF